MTTERLVLNDQGVTIYQGDALNVLRGLPDGSVHMAVTSPPFYGLRDYQIEGQIGVEETPEAWAQRLTDVFREVRRVLRDDGTFWLECGDNFAGSGSASKQLEARNSRVRNPHKMRSSTLDAATSAKHNEKMLDRQLMSVGAIAGYKPRDLVLAPFLLAMAVRADGWFLRSVVVWEKNGMPESVINRPTINHSYLFMLTKQGSEYYYDQESARERSTMVWNSKQSLGVAGRRSELLLKENPGRHTYNPNTIHADVDRHDRNMRSVWRISTEPLSIGLCRKCRRFFWSHAPLKCCKETVISHYAAFPQKLVSRLLSISTSHHGVCCTCGAPWRRLRVSVDPVPYKERSRLQDRKRELLGTKITCGKGAFEKAQTALTGWQPSCDCRTNDPVPAVVLDPFLGSGTTAAVARTMKRRAIGIELNPDYAEMASKRLRHIVPAVVY